MFHTAGGLMDGVFNTGLFDTDQMYGQRAWTGKPAKRNAWLLMQIPFKWMLLPVLPTPNSAPADA